MTQDENTPLSFYQLLPDQVLDAVESVGLEPQAALLALNSYENRVYQFRDWDEKRWVIKFYRPQRWSDEQILEEHAFSLALAEAEIPVVAPVVFNQQTLVKHQGYRFAIFESHGGRTPDLENEDYLQWIGRFIGRIHGIGQTQTFKHRPTLSLQSFAIDSVDYLLQHQFIPSHILPAYQAISQQLIQICQEKLHLFDHSCHIRLHGDCHPSNILWTDSGPHFVDFDDARMGPAVQDLWMLIDNLDDKRLWNKLVSGYEDFMDFDDRQMKMIEPLRAMRMIHYSAWLARRWQDPAFPRNFPWFNSTRYWEEHILSLKEQLSAIQHQ